MTRIRRKYARIVIITPRHLEDARWWYQTHDEAGVQFDAVTTQRIGSRMGRYYRGIAVALNRKLLTEVWVKKVGVTKAALVAEMVLKTNEKLPAWAMQVIADPTLTVRELKQWLHT